MPRHYENSAAGPWTTKAGRRESGPSPFRSGSAPSAKEICPISGQTGKPDDTLSMVADNILDLLEISTFNNWSFKEE